jgi:hypothetical protein
LFLHVRLNRSMRARPAVCSVPRDLFFCIRCRPLLLHVRHAARSNVVAPNNPRANCLISSFFRHYRGQTPAGGTSSSSEANMRLFIATIVALIISGCAGAAGFTDISTLQKGPAGKTWTQEAFESKGD